jgi:hypothetical protein
MDDMAIDDVSDDGMCSFPEYEMPVTRRRQWLLALAQVLVLFFHHCWRERWVTLVRSWLAFDRCLAKTFSVQTCFLFQCFDIRSLQIVFR